MTELHIAPKGTDAIQLGTLIDDNGQRFVGMIFADENGDMATITMLIPTFVALAAHMSATAEKLQTRDYWRDHPRD